jgi:hypothetical protein
VDVTKAIGALYVGSIEPPVIDEIVEWLPPDGEHVVYALTDKSCQCAGDFPPRLETTGHEPIAIRFRPKVPRLDSPQFREWSVAYTRSQPTTGVVRFALLAEVIPRIRVSLKPVPPDGIVEVREHDRAVPLTIFSAQAREEPPAELRLYCETEGGQIEVGERTVTETAHGRTTAYSCRLVLADDVFAHSPTVACMIQAVQERNDELRFAVRVREASAIRAEPSTLFVTLTDTDVIRRRVQITLPNAAEIDAVECETPTVEVQGLTNWKASRHELDVVIQGRTVSQIAGEAPAQVPWRICRTTIVVRAAGRTLGIPATIVLRDAVR